MKIRILTTILFSFLPILANAFQDKARYKVRHITNTEGLPSNTVRAMVQDPYGYIWVGGTNGLSRYDGYRFVDFNNFSLPDKTNSTQHIGLMHIDRVHDLLWVMTSTYSAACYGLRLGHFLDVTKPDDKAQQLTKRFFGSDAVLLYEKGFGVRHPIPDGDHFRLLDYTCENGSLPSDEINRVVEDSLHRFWIATSKGLTVIEDRNTPRQALKGINVDNCITNGYRTAAFCKDNQTFYVFDSKLRRTGIYRIPSYLGLIETLNNIIFWQDKVLCFTPEGTYVLDANDGAITKPDKYQIPRGFLQGLIDGYQFVANRSGNLWVFPPRGDVRKLELSHNLHSTNEKNKIYSFARDKKGLFYIASYGMGLFTYNPTTGELHQYTAHDEYPLISSDYLLDVMVDRSGSIWVSAESAGLSCIQPIDDINAEYYYIDVSKKGDWTNNVRYLFKAKDGLWHVSTKDNNLYSFNPSNGIFSFEKTLKAGIYNYMFDSHGQEWIATRGDGLYIGNVHYGKSDAAHPLPSNDFFNTAEDSRGRIWVASWNGGLLMTEYRNGRLMPFRQFLNGGFNERRIHDLEMSPDGKLFVATLNGLYVVDTRKKNITDKDFVSYNTGNKGLPGNEVICLKYAYGSLWAGVTANGVVRCDFSKGIDRMSHSVYGQHEGLADNDVRTINADSMGYLWVGSGSGLSRINVSDGGIKKYDLSGNTQNNSFTENSARTLEDGRLMFGTENGVLIVSPKQEQDNRLHLNKVYLTDLLVNGTSIYEKLDSVIPDSALEVTHKIRLSHNQNSLTLYFSNFQYSDIQSQLYRVRMDGVDKGWSRASTNNYVNYSNLAPGTYRFRVSCLNGNKWSEATSLAIVISQPWYNTWWAWIIYLVATAAVVLYVYRNANERIRLHQQMRLEKQLTDFRLDFFTHITHEFRTPLAIIQNGVSQLLSPQSKSVEKSALQTTQRGTRRLLRLVNRLMEFRKINTGNIKLNVEKGDIVGFVRNVWHDLYSIAKQKDLNYMFTPFDKAYEMLFDRQAVETITYNLLSNAIKYTPDKGSVTLTITHDTDCGHVVITVQDNGQGISKEQQKQLFKPFMHGYVSKGGMGIGLYMAHELAEKHHGSLAYSNNPMGKGSRFVFVLPDKGDVYSDDEYRMATAIDTESIQEKKADEVIGSVRPEALNTQTVAIIEDDPDMQLQIKEAVGYYFKTVCFTNGSQGYDGVMEAKPDLIICDVMLPDMDGYEIISKLKSDPSMAFTPVIMLTALDDEEHQIKGYKSGADDYMVKPCNFRLLIARIIQLISWREQHPAEVSQQAEQADYNTDATVKPPAVVKSKADKIFIENIQTLVLQHMGDADFSVDTLAQMMRMGRSKFYGKMKEVFGTSPNKYILDERLRVAAELLVEGRYNITEITEKIGFTDSSYFYRCFKNKYGVAPSKYKG